jgi:hypothetical protein
MNEVCDSGGHVFNPPHARTAIVFSLSESLLKWNGRVQLDGPVPWERW